MHDSGGFETLVRETTLLMPDDIAHAVVFFALSQAKNITGQTLNVDGGYVMN